MPEEIMDVPCKNCLCLAICKGMASALYDEIKSNEQYSSYDAYEIMTMIEHGLVDPLTNKCNNLVVYISMKESTSPPSYSISKNRLLTMMAYINLELYTIYMEAREYAEKMYQRYFDNKNKKIYKESEDEYKVTVY